MSSFDSEFSAFLSLSKDQMVAILKGAIQSSMLNIDTDESATIEKFASEAFDEEGGAFFKVIDNVKQRIRDRYGVAIEEVMTPENMTKCFASIIESHGCRQAFGMTSDDHTKQIPHILESVGSMVKGISKLVDLAKSGQLPAIFDVDLDDSFQETQSGDEDGAPSPVSVD